MNDLQKDKEIILLRKALAKLLKRFEKRTALIPDLQAQINWYRRRAR